jgi:hypothetical protein
MPQSEVSHYAIHTSHVQTYYWLLQESREGLLAANQLDLKAVKVLTA